MSDRLVQTVAVAALAAWVGFGARAGELETAQAALQDRLYPVAQLHAERALRESGGDRAQALLVLVEAQWEQGLFGEMLRTLDAHDAVARGAPHPEAFVFWRASALLSAGRPEEAVSLTGSAVLPAGSSYGDALRRVGARAKLALGDSEGALSLFADVERTSTNGITRAANALEWAMALDQAGRPEAALEVLKKQSELGVQSVAVNDGTLMRGRLLMRMGKEIGRAHV